MTGARYETALGPLGWLEVGPEFVAATTGYLPAGPARRVRVMVSDLTPREARLYLWAGGMIYLLAPCWTAWWDAEVARVLGAEVAPYTVSAGGEILAAVEAPPSGGRVEVGVGEQVGLFG